MSSYLASEIEYFSTFGPTTDIACHAVHIDPLPSDPAALGHIVRGILMHNWTAAMNGIASTPDRDGMTIFGAEATIDRILSIDPAPLDEQRPEEMRLIGFCYHFALVHCALLRAKGVPSRARCGFASYLIDGKWTDHWVVEHWDGSQWRLNDPQIGLDELTPDDFHDGVRAWQLCRTGDANPADHGNGELWGWDELRGSLVNDIGALNKIEVGDWDWCGLLRVEPLDQPHPRVDARLDAVADLATPGRASAQLHEAFHENAAIRPPHEVISPADKP